MDTKEYGDRLAKLLSAGDWERIEPEIHAIDLPAGWQEMVKPMFADLAGKDLTVETIAFDDLPEHMLRWLKRAPPEVLADTREALRFSFDVPVENGRDSGNIELAVYRGESGPSILMVGG